jgi:pimeloyl-ACP methyl ester carboxylesterase
MLNLQKTPEKLLRKVAYFYIMQTLLLLHGAIGAKDQLEPLANAMRDHVETHLLNFSGHGGEPFAAAPFSMALFAEEVLAYLEKKAIPSVNIFGYSMGGYVGMYLARHYPDKVNTLITLATKYHWDKATADKEVKMLDAPAIRRKIPAFADQLQQRHAPNDWETVLEKTKDLLLQLGETNVLTAEDYAAVITPCLILLGDRDKMVTREETVQVYQQLPVAQLGILPGTPHPLEQVDLSLLSLLVNRFLTRHT